MFPFCLLAEKKKKKTFPIPWSTSPDILGTHNTVCTLADACGHVDPVWGNLRHLAHPCFQEMHVNHGE